MPFVIDIDPVAAAPFGIPLRWYGLILVVAASVAIWVTLREARRRGIADRHVWDGAIWVAVASLAGGRALYVFQNELGTIGEHPAHLFMVWTGGLSFYGGLAGALIALTVFARRRGLPLLRILDIAAPGAAIGQAIGHIGCLIGGDSAGIPTDLPWAVIYRNPAAMAPLNVPLHPTQAYEAILLSLLFAAMWLSRERLQRLGDGVVASLYLGGLAVIRFGLFFLRAEEPAFLGLKTAQWIGLGIMVLAGVLLASARREHGRLAPAPLDGPSRSAV